MATPYPSQAMIPRAGYRLLAARNARAFSRASTETRTSTHQGRVQGSRRVKGGLCTWPPASQSKTLRTRRTWCRLMLTSSSVSGERRASVARSKGICGVRWNAQAMPGKFAEMSVAVPRPVAREDSKGRAGAGAGAEAWERCTTCMSATARSSRGGTIYIWRRSGWGTMPTLFSWSTICRWSRWTLARACWRKTRTAPSSSIW